MCGIGRWVWGLAVPQHSTTLNPYRAVSDPRRTRNTTILYFTTLLLVYLLYFLTFHVALLLYCILNVATSSRRTRRRAPASSRCHTPAAPAPAPRARESSSRALLTRRRAPRLLAGVPNAPRAFWHKTRPELFGGRWKNNLGHCRHVRARTEISAGAPNTGGAAWRRLEPRSINCGPVARFILIWGIVFLWAIGASAMEIGLMRVPNDVESLPPPTLTAQTPSDLRTETHFLALALPKASSLTLAPLPSILCFPPAGLLFPLGGAVGQGLHPHLYGEAHIGLRHPDGG